ncbi:MAG: hypothetical protein ACYS3N_13000 [Planctomycetota bacterium]
MKKTISRVLVLALDLAREITKADFIFGTPIPVPSVNSSASDENPTTSSDGLSLYYCSLRTSISGIVNSVTCRRMRYWKLCKVCNLHIRNYDVSQ